MSIDVHRFRSTGLDELRSAASAAASSSRATAGMTRRDGSTTG